MGGFSLTRSLQRLENMRSKQSLLILFLTLNSFSLFSQNTEGDKIRKEIDSLCGVAFNFYDKPDSALWNYEKAERIAIHHGDSIRLADVWSGLGSFYYTIGQYRKSIDFSKKSKIIYLLTGDTINAGWSGYTAGISYKYWGKYREALQEIQEDIHLFEKKNDIAGISNCYIVAGYINQAWRNYAEAERICRITLKQSNDLGNKQGVGYSQLAIGNSFASRNQFDSANVYFQRALTNFSSTNSHYGIALAYRDIGSFYLQRNEVAKAFQYYRQSLELLQKTSNQRGISEVLALMGEAYLQQKDYSKALKLLQESQSIALKMELNEDIINNYINISKAYEQWGKKDIALDYHKKYTHLKDSVFNEEKHFQIAELQTLYETEKKEQQIALKNIQIEKYQSISRLQRYLIAAFVLAFILASSIAFLAYRWYQIKKSDNKLLSEQKLLIEFKNTQITDSINYAKRIQGALLGKLGSKPTDFNDLFIYYRPKDIVSGDFYYIKEIENYTIIAAADCTGHGVPGAFMSMLGITLLNEIFSHSTPQTASEILEQLRFKLKESLNQTVFQSDTRDGMDIALCLIDKNKSHIQYVGAYQPLILIRDNELVEFKATRNPVGVFIKEFPFENHTIQIKPNDTFYIFSDGYGDQVGGLGNQKFKVAEFKKLLKEIHTLSMSEQPKILEKRILEWRGDVDQTDDIMVIGFKV